jgi:protocatechuate 3,4-dioxygenase beta subunit
MRSAVFILVIVVTFGCIESPAGLAESQSIPAVSALRAANDIVWSQLTIRVLDPDGNPVAGATVRPWAYRAGRAHGVWNETNYGAPRRTFSDSNGETVVDYPESVAWEGERMELVSQVSLHISHPDFCANSPHIDVGRDVSEITLVRGVRLRFAGVEPGRDRPLSHCHVMLESGESDEPEFVTQSDGWLRSVPVHEDRQVYLVVRAVPGEHPQFSEPQSWTPDVPASREAKVEVRPGVRVIGKVSDNVKRPIERGHVLAWCGCQVAEGARLANRHGRPIWWREVAPIARDGSFEFPSLPPGFMAQFYAFANDSISAQPTDEEYEACCEWFGAANRNMNDRFRNGQVLELVGASSEITIQMEPAGLVRVKCIDKDGQPVSGATVTTWPNQFMVGGGSTVFCDFDTSNSTLERLRNPKPWTWPQGGLFSLNSNDRGEVAFRNMPRGKQSIIVFDDRWVSDDDQTVDVEANETAEIELVLRPKE